jgi:hypothetical protein
MDLRFATLKAAFFYLLHNVSTLNQCRKLPCGTVVCKHFAIYQGYPNYKWDFGGLSVKGRIELYSYSPSILVACSSVTFTFTFYQSIYPRFECGTF